MRTSCISRSAVAHAPALDMSRCMRSGSAICVADLHQRVQRCHRVLEDHRHLLAPDVAHLLAARGHRSRGPRTRMLPWRIVPRGGSKPMIDRDRIVLPEPLSPTMPSALPRSSVERDAVDGTHQAARRLEVGAARLSSCSSGPVGAPCVEAWMPDAHTAASRMSNLRANRSPMKLKLSTVRNRNRHGKIVAHQALSRSSRARVDHLAPCLRSLDAEPEEGQRALGGDQDAETGEGHRDHRRHEVGHDLPPDHACGSWHRGCAPRARTRARAGRASGRARCGRTGRSTRSRA